MDKIASDAKMYQIITRTPDMFTTKEFALRYNVAAGTAGDRLRKLIQMGRVEFVGKGSQKERLYRLKS